VKFLLDTNAVIEILWGTRPVLANLTRQLPEDCAISAIVAHELFYGACRGRRRTENLARVEALRFAVLEFDREDARCAGEVRADLAARGQSIGPYDVLIAGQALARSLTLVTHNIAEFRRVPGLVLQDWQD
jgi:tRNA(fMet)-specific endonuclease VapC